MKLLETLMKQRIKWPEDQGEFAIWCPHAGPDGMVITLDYRPSKPGASEHAVNALGGWSCKVPDDYMVAVVTRSQWIEARYERDKPVVPAWTPGEESQASQCNYYQVQVLRPQNPDQKGVPYILNCEDMIQALDMTFDEGCETKSLFRRCRARQGFAKAESTAVRDAAKAVHYAQRILAHEQAKVNK